MGLNRTTRGQFEDKGWAYSKEVIYSSSDQHYGFGDDQQQQVKMACKPGVCSKSFISFMLSLNHECLILAW